MIRRTFLKMLLASPLLGFLKKKEPEILYEFHKSPVRRESCLSAVSEIPGVSGEEVLLGRIILDGGSITVPPEESWTVTKLRIDGRIGYIYGYINAGGS